VISSYNRNFVGRHDGNPATHSFVTSPELVAAFAFAGSLQFNPATETIATPDGKAFAFSAPHAEELPSHFEDGTALYQAPPENGEDVEVHVAPGSQNLQLLTPFEPWHEGKARDLSILIKVQGKKYHLLTHSPTQSPSSQYTLTPHPQENAQPTTSPPPAPGTNTAATSRTSPTTCSPAQRPSTAATRSADTLSTPSQVSSTQSPKSQKSTGTQAYDGALSATGTTAKVPAASTPLWSRDSSEGWR
jgi:hypothetical protein